MLTPRRPLNAMFVITSMPIGGAETLLANMMRQFDPKRIRPSVCCLKDKGELGEAIEQDFSLYSDVIKGKFDVGVVARLRRLYRENEIDAVVTVGAGDKMFWGRLAARYSKVPVILSALHSTGWPDGVGRLNRLLTGITTGFIAVAKPHGEHLIKYEGFPEDKVFVIPNGIDTSRFQFCQEKRNEWREELEIDVDAPVVGIVAALRPEKNHSLFVEAAAKVKELMPNARFVIIGDGPERSKIEAKIEQFGLQGSVLLPGSTHDIPGALSMCDMFALTSDNEASPVSILEAMACQLPVVSSDVGSVHESVIHGKTGFLVKPGDVDSAAKHWVELLGDSELRQIMGENSRAHVLNYSSLDSMTLGYTELIEKLHFGKPVTTAPTEDGHHVDILDVAPVESVSLLD
ncbi:MAG: glycosyltransferase [Planctomycetota bacterium]